MNFIDVVFHGPELLGFVHAEVAAEGVVGQVLALVVHQVALALRRVVAEAADVDWEKAVKNSRKISPKQKFFF